MPCSLFKCREIVSIVASRKIWFFRPLVKDETVLKELTLMLLENAHEGERFFAFIITDFFSHCKRGRRLFEKNERGETKGGD